MADSPAASEAGRAAYYRATFDTLTRGGTRNPTRVASLLLPLLSPTTSDPAAVIREAELQLGIASPADATAAPLAAAAAPAASGVDARPAAPAAQPPAAAAAPTEGAPPCDGTFVALFAAAASARANLALGGAHAAESRGAYQMRRGKSGTQRLGFRHPAAYNKLMSHVFTLFASRRRLSSAFLLPAPGVGGSGAQPAATPLLMSAPTPVLGAAATGLAAWADGGASSLPALDGGAATAEAAVLSALSPAPPPPLDSPSSDDELPPLVAMEQSGSSSGGGGGGGSAAITRAPAAPPAPPPLPPCPVNVAEVAATYALLMELAAEQPAVALVNALAAALAYTVSRLLAQVRSWARHRSGPRELALNPAAVLAPLLVVALCPFLEDPAHHEVVASLCSVVAKLPVEGRELLGAWLAGCGSAMRGALAAAGPASAAATRGSGGGGSQPDDGGGAVYQPRVASGACDCASRAAVGSEALRAVEVAAAAVLRASSLRLSAPTESRREEEEEEEEEEGEGAGAALGEATGPSAAALEALSSRAPAADAGGRGAVAAAAASASSSLTPAPGAAPLSQSSGRAAALVGGAGTAAAAAPAVSPAAADAANAAASAVALLGSLEASGRLAPIASLFTLRRAAAVDPPCSTALAEGHGLTAGESSAGACTHEQQPAAASAPEGPAAASSSAPPPLPAEAACGSDDGGGGGAAAAAAAAAAASACDAPANPAAALLAAAAAAAQSLLCRLGLHEPEDAPAFALRRCVDFTQQWITIKLFERAVRLEEEEEGPRGLSLAEITPPVVWLGVLNAANEGHCTSRGARALAYSAFYNEVISSEVNLADDWGRWQAASAHAAAGQADAHTAIFSFCGHPFILDAAAKGVILQVDAEQQQQGQASVALLAALFGGGGLAAMSPYFVLPVRREHLVDDAMAAILQAPQRSALKKPLRVEFHGEEGVDAGGVRKEFFSLLVRQLLVPSFGMFVEDSVTGLLWFSADAFTAGCTALQFELVGSLLAMALYNSVLLEARFPLALYRKLKGERLSLRDLDDWQPHAARGLRALLAHTEQEGGAVEDVFCLDFTAARDTAFGERVAVELARDGAATPVTASNRGQYVAAYLRWLLSDSVAGQFEPFARGFRSVAGGPAMGLFRAEELAACVTGCSVLDLRALEAGARYEEPYSASSPSVRSLWAVVHALPPEEQRRFLAFCTGSDRAPLRGLASLGFIVMRSGLDSDNLPGAATCFNTLQLPDYGDQTKLEAKLRLAINHGEGFGLR